MPPSTHRSELLRSTGFEKDYKKLDLVEACLFDNHMSAEKGAEVLGVPLGIVAEAVTGFEATKHKREYLAIVNTKYRV